MTLQDKIEHSIQLIRKTEKLALAMNDQGFLVGFSGGKDSQVLLELVKMAGVRYKAVYNVTTNDPVENVRFIKEHYPDVFFDRPKESFFQLVEKYGMPTMTMRYCCRILKESKGVGFVTLTGVRAEESSKRSKYYDGTGRDIRPGTLLRHHPPPAVPLPVHTKRRGHPPGDRATSPDPQTQKVHNKTIINTII